MSDCVELRIQVFQYKIENYISYLKENKPNAVAGSENIHKMPTIFINSNYTFTFNLILFIENITVTILFRIYLISSKQLYLL